MEQRATSCLRREFWTAFGDLESASGTVKSGKPSSDSRMHHNGGLNGGTLFTMVRVRQGEIGTQLALDDITADTICSFLRAHKGEIDSRWRPRSRAARKS